MGLKPVVGEDQTGFSPDDQKHLYTTELFNIIVIICNNFYACNNNFVIFVTYSEKRDLRA